MKDEFFKGPSWWRPDAPAPFGAMTIWPDKYMPEGLIQDLAHVGDTQAFAERIRYLQGQAIRVETLLSDITSGAFDQLFLALEDDEVTEHCGVILTEEHIHAVMGLIRSMTR